MLKTKLQNHLINILVIFWLTCTHVKRLDELGTTDAEAADATVGLLNTIEGFIMNKTPTLFVKVVRVGSILVTSAYFPVRKIERFYV